MTKTRWSAARWAELSARVYLFGALPAFAAGVLIAGLSLWLPATERFGSQRWAATLLLLATGGVLVATILGSGVTESRRRREAALGHTSFRLDAKELSQVVPGTDFVIRKAGDRFLTADEYFEAVAAAGAAGQPADVKPRRQTWRWQTGVIIILWVTWAAVISTVAATASGGFDLVLVVFGTLVGTAVMFVAVPAGLSRVKSKGPPNDH